MRQVSSVDRAVQRISSSQRLLAAISRSHSSDSSALVGGGFSGGGFPTNSSLLASFQVELAEAAEQQTRLSHQVGIAMGGKVIFTPPVYVAFSIPRTK